jgi:hypothetical protein
VELLPTELLRRPSFEGIVVLDDMITQLAKHKLTFADIKEGARFEVQTE